MTALLLGLILFLGLHSVRIVADDWRTAQIAQLGLRTWKLAYTALSLVGLGLIIWGYGQARQTPVVLWAVPTGLRHLAVLLTVPVFILLVAAHVPGNGLRRRVGHPMVLAVKFWAVAHLLANNTAADLLLFGSFLVWAVLDFRSARRRPPAPDVALAAATVPTNAGLRTAATVVIGLLVWVFFALHAHAWLIGVRPLA